MTAVIGLLLLTFAIFNPIVSTEALPGVPKLEGNIISLTYMYLKHGIPELLNRLIAASNDGISYTNVANTVVVSIHEPALVQEVLKLPVEVASREGEPGRMIWSPFATLRRLTGKTLFTDTGPNVKLHRKIFGREFNTTSSLADKFKTVSEVAVAHVDALTGNGRTGRINDLKFVTDKFAISAWGELLYGNPWNDVDGKVWSVSEKILFFSGSIWNSITYAIQVYLGILTPGAPSHSESKICKNIAQIINKNMNILEEYVKKNYHAPMKLIRTLSVQTGGQEAGPLSEFATEFASLNVFGGHVYIGSLVSFILMELDNNPDCFQQLMAEIKTIDDSDFKAVNCQMPYLDAVVSEIMRLYPGVIALIRIVNQEVTLTSYRIQVALEPGMLVICSILQMHTSPEYWGADATQFVPKRFLDGNGKNNQAFMPVGYGPRNCIAYRIGILLVKVFLVKLLKSYQVDVIDHDHEVRVGASTLLETRKPVAVMLSRL